MGDGSGLLKKQWGVNQSLRRLWARVKCVQFSWPGVCVHVCTSECAWTQPRVFLPGLRLWSQYPEDKHPKSYPRGGTNITSSKSNPKQVTAQGGARRAEGSSQGAEHRPGCTDKSCSVNAHWCSLPQGPGCTLPAWAHPSLQHPMRWGLFLSQFPRWHRRKLPVRVCYPLAQPHDHMGGEGSMDAQAERLYQPKDKDRRANVFWVFCPVTWRLSSFLYIQFPSDFYRFL